MEKKKTRNYFMKIFRFLFVAILLWVSISNILQSLKCPEMSQTELFLNIPKSFVCDFRICN